MGRKIKLLLVLSALLYGICGCADFELCVKKELKTIKPRVVLVGPFEIRNMNFDPYASEEFRDALKFEFFRSGYNTICVPKIEQNDNYSSVWAEKICTVYSGDILIRGVISQRETGFLAERENATRISFTVYNRSGEVIGEGFYYDNESAGDESFRRRAAERFVSELISKIEKAD